MSEINGTTVLSVDSVLRGIQATIAPVVLLSAVICGVALLILLDHHIRLTLIGNGCGCSPLLTLATAQIMTKCALITGIIAASGLTIYAGSVLTRHFREIM